ncbi:hypothetical protein GUITHDRAFT_104880 [Guillardia theta CCMP2712]|uniref:Uncharacterized protein n=1 Tax=Guillardia theta (strain CCMP2712) TaxID=905079 RepID=L1JMR5_GUITC|nr:hypothetical protein GUITHDRAFT_104880 [Guillardia theta CCMP2712]EKX49353.1 hypothetical protein GUITHDRAFT_104880 [Guillardia theta CCMP2712]|eukprot:XP_005836333.1 hypothetical protein GUITHDRAFT_104880 [Guillardia theta CCMP2712]
MSTQRVNVTRLKKLAAQFLDQVFDDQFAKLSYNDMRLKIGQSELAWSWHTLLPCLVRTVRDIRTKFGLPFPGDYTLFETYNFATDSMRVFLIHYHPDKTFGSNSVLERDVIEKANIVFSKLQDLHLQTKQRFNMRNHYNWWDILQSLLDFNATSCLHRTKTDESRSERLKRQLEYEYQIDALWPHNNPDLKMRKMDLDKKRLFTRKEYMFLNGYRKMQILDLELKSKGFNVEQDEDKLPVESERNTSACLLPEEYCPLATKDQLAYEVFLNPKVVYKGWNMNEPCHLFRKIRDMKDTLCIDNIRKEWNYNPRTLEETKGVIRYILDIIPAFLFKDEQNPVITMFDTKDDAKFEDQLQNVETMILFVRETMALLIKCASLHQGPQTTCTHQRCGRKKLSNIRQSDPNENNWDRVKLQEIQEKWNVMKNRLRTMTSDNGLEVIADALALVLASVHDCNEIKLNFKMLDINMKIFHGTPIFIRHHFHKDLHQDPSRVDSMCDWIKISLDSLLAGDATIKDRLLSGECKAYDLVMNACMMQLITREDYPTSTNLPFMMRYDKMRLRQFRLEFRMDCLSVSMLGIALQRLSRIPVDSSDIQGKLIQFFNNYRLSIEADTAFPEFETKQYSYDFVIDSLRRHLIEEDKNWLATALSVEDPIAELFAFPDILWNASIISVTKKWMDILAMEQPPAFDINSVQRFPVKQSMNLAGKLQQALRNSAAKKSRLESLRKELLAIEAKSSKNASSRTTGSEGGIPHMQAHGNKLEIRAEEEQVGAGEEIPRTKEEEETVLGEYSLYAAPSHQQSCDAASSLREQPWQEAAERLHEYEEIIVDLHARMQNMLQVVHTVAQEYQQERATLEKELSEQRARQEEELRAAREELRGALSKVDEMKLKQQNRAARELLDYFRDKFLEMGAGSARAAASSESSCLRQTSCRSRSKQTSQEVEQPVQLFARSLHPIAHRMSELESWRLRCEELGKENRTLTRRLVCLEEENMDLKHARATMKKDSSKVLRTSEVCLQGMQRKLAAQRQQLRAYEIRRREDDKYISRLEKKVIEAPQPHDQPEHPKESSGQTPNDGCSLDALTEEGSSEKGGSTDHSSSAPPPSRPDLRDDLVLSSDEDDPEDEEETLRGTFQVKEL